MSTPPLDQLVKGAPASETDTLVTESSPSPPLFAAPVSAAPRLRSDPQVSPAAGSRPATPDPLATLPSSPPQIYLNLLILESSLRAQYLALRERRRQNTFFLLLLALWIAYFGYALFLRPREDGSGVGGSVYWVVEMGEKVALLGGIITAILVWGTGQWERGVRWPRRWLAVANRGLRGMNTKIVIIRGPLWRELLSYLSFIFPYGSLFQFPYNHHSIERQTPSEKRAHRQHHPADDSDSDVGLFEEDLTPGGDYIRLLLLPKAFSPEFRENWDDYRTEYWEKENGRRGQLRRKLREHARQTARQEQSWFKWMNWRTSTRRRRVLTPERSHAQTSTGKHHEPRPRRSTLSGSQSHHSRNVSRNITTTDGLSLPTPDQGNHRRKKSNRHSIAKRPSSLAPSLVRESTPSVSSDDSSSIGGKRGTPEKT